MYVRAKKRDSSLAMYVKANKRDLLSSHVCQGKEENTGGSESKLKKATKEQNTSTHVFFV